MSAVERVGVVGAGTMGAGIAQIAALGGYETRLHDPIPAALTSGIERLRGALAKGAEKGRWSEKDVEAAGARAGGAASIDDLADCDLVVEAAPEDLELKRKLFAALADTCGPDTILASNTSSLPVTAIAAGVPHPERVVGMHFFNPPALMKLVEVVATERSSEAALDATAEVGRRMGRTPIRAKDSPGFIANRLARPFSLESLRMLAEGIADTETIDRVCRLGGGFRMGPFELIDLIGLDVNLSVARSFYSQGGSPSAGGRARSRNGWSAKVCSAARAAAASTSTATARTVSRTPSGGSKRRRSTPPSWRGSTPPPKRSCSASSPRSPTRRPSRSPRRSARRPT